MTVTARSEDDIDEEDILSRVSKASGSNYSFHKEVARPMEAQTGPVVCYVKFSIVYLYDGNVIYKLIANLVFMFFSPSPQSTNEHCRSEK